MVYNRPNMLKKFLFTIGAVILLFGSVYLASKYHVEKNTLRRFTNSVASAKARSSHLGESNTEKQSLNKSTGISTITDAYTNTSGDFTLEQNTSTIPVKTTTKATNEDKTTTNATTVKSITDQTTMSSIATHQSDVKSVAATEATTSSNSPKSTDETSSLVNYTPSTADTNNNSVTSVRMSSKHSSDITLSNATDATAVGMTTIYSYGTANSNETVKVSTSGSKGMSPVLSVVVVVGCVLVLVVVIAVVIKLVRNCKTIRFRRLHEMPMDDFDDYSAVYAEHTVPVRNSI